MGAPRRTRDDSWFTLLELLIVMVILGVLAAIAVFAVGGMNQATAVTACKADYKTVETALGAYDKARQGTPPPPSISSSVCGLREPPASSNGYVIGIDPTTENVTVQSTNPAHARRGRQCQLRLA